MQAGEWVVLAYAGLYLSALSTAARRRGTFPWSESILILLIVGFGFTGLVYWVTGNLIAKQPSILTPPTESGLTGLYVAATTVLLVFRPAPERWKGQFLKERPTGENLLTNAQKLI